MILHSDHIIELDYEPAKDILVTCLQSVRDYDAVEVRKAFITISSYVREYNISRLLLDFTRNTLDLTEPEYKATMAQLTVGLLQTPLQKVARLTTNDATREQKIFSTLEAIKGSVPLPVDVRMFNSSTDAMFWLQQ